MTVAPTNDTGFVGLGNAMLINTHVANSALLSHLTNRGRDGETPQSSLSGTQPVKVAFDGGARMNGMLAQLPDAIAEMGGWFRAIGNFSSLSGAGNVPGFDTQGGGFLAGIERPFGDELTMGFAGGYSRTDFSGTGTTGTIDTPRVALYGSYEPGRWGFDGAIGYGYNSVSAARPIAALGATASSHHDGHEADADLQARARLDVSGFTIVPAAGLEYVHLYETGFTESGAPGFDLTVSNRNSDSLRPFVGASVERRSTMENGIVLTAEADFAFSYELFATPPSLVQVGGGSFDVDGLVPSRDQITLGGEVTASMNDRLALYADYQVVPPTGNLFQQTVSAGFRYRF